MLSKIAVAQKQPNILLILVDDLGWNDLSCYGSPFYETPNLDKLAATGIRFTNAYASSPVCSPTRASILTGKYPIKTDITDWIPGRHANGKAKNFEKLVSNSFQQFLPFKEETIAEIASQANYKTLHVGKWHLGDQENTWPEFHGFQTNIGGFGKGSPSGFMNDSTGGFFTPYANPRLADGPAGEFITDRLTNETLKFIKDTKEKPFFIFYSMYAVHNPMQAPKNLVQKYTDKKRLLNIHDSVRFSKNEDWMKNEKGWKKRNIQDNATYAAMIENMDANIGRITYLLKKLDLFNNTLIIFTSDNGGLSTAEGSPTSNGKLKAGKGWLYEGGIRVPFIMHWPNKKLSHLTCTIPVNSIDILPTIQQAIFPSKLLSKTIDGKNIYKLIKEQNTARPMFWHYPHYSNQGGKPASAIYKKGYKLIVNHEDNSTELYKLTIDLAEQNNLSSIDSNTTRLLTAELESWLKANNAKYPVANFLNNAGNN